MANRQARRKEKNHSKRRVVADTLDDSMSNLIKIGIIVIIIFVVFYILTLALAGNSKNNDTADNNDTKTPVSIQYDEILAGEVFNMKNTEYYVLFYDFSDSTTNFLYSSMVNSFKTNHTGTRIYTVDLSKGFSSSYIAGTSNPSAQKIEDLKVKGPTAIKFSNGQNVSFVEGKDSIRDILK